MIFPDKPTQIQSEVPLMYRNSKSADLLAHMKTQSALMPKKKQKEVAFDRDNLTYECHHAMISGLCLVADKLCAQIKDAEQEKKLNILVLGTGTGILPMFLCQHFSKYLEKITTVEIDAGVLIAARDHFGFQAENEPLIDSVCADAHEWVLSQGEANTGKYDMVFIDINYEEGEAKVNPPLKFFSAEFIGKLT
mmetsp:Transcript_3905/g.4607  ORF Transcript_3905/g.4607 Transcript_3905/m.4607 type:complete len:193 (-) Transcript_3905:399-977(-)